jgi:hypothetical protein
MGAGVLTTLVNRRLNTMDLRDDLTRGAYVVGADAHVFLDGRKDWVLVGNVAKSVVTGTAAAIERLQEAPQRYFQRPDAPQVKLDSTRTSLDGFTGRINLNRNSGLWKINASLWTVSPGFESNDLGFHGTGDRSGMHAVFFFRDIKVRSFSRSWSAWIAKYYTWNFGHDRQSDGVGFSFNWTFLNYWNAGINGNANWKALDDRLTRGGPSAESPGGGNWNVYANTDSRTSINVSANANYRWTHAGGWNRNVGANLTLKPSARVNVTFGPNVSRSHTVAQYVTDVTDASASATYGSRYVFGALDQTQVSMTTRVSFVVSPTVSFQLYAQPLLASGDYDHFKELARPRSFEFGEYGSALGTLSRNSQQEYSVDPDGDGPAASFTFDDPDFNLKSLRVNAVFRWEMKPGSTFYAVWTRRQEDESHPGTFKLGRDAQTMLTAAGDDVILFKLAYWIGR